jgi:hypothetical protein
MNYMVLFKKAQKLRFFKLFYALCFLVIVMFSGCGKNDKNQEQPVSFKTEDERIVEFVNNTYHCKEAKVLKGVYKPNYELFAVVYEINSGTDFGIKFMLAHIHADSVIVDYNSNLVDGAVNQSVFERVNVTGKGYDLVYYSSSDYFMGSGGGEVFTYVIDFNEPSLAYGHLYISGEGAPKFYIPSTVEDKSIREFLIRRIKSDFSDIKPVSQDFKFVN